MPHWDYLPAGRLTPVGRLRRARRRWFPPAAVDVSDGACYEGWTARIVSGADPSLPPEGTRGLVARATKQGGQLTHQIDFPTTTITAPLPWPGIDLIR